MPKLKTTFSLDPDNPDLKSIAEYIGNVGWEDRREALIDKLNNPNENPDNWSDVDKKDLKLLLEEQLNGKVIADFSKITSQMAHKMKIEIDQMIINDLTAMARVAAKIIGETNDRK